MDSRRASVAPAPAVLATQVPVRTDGAVPQGDVIGITLAAVGTLILIFAATLLYYFYKHKRLELYGDTDKTQMRSAEAELSLGPEASSARSVFKPPEPLEAIHLTGTTSASIHFTSPGIQPEVSQTLAPADPDMLHPEPTPSGPPSRPGSSSTHSTSISLGSRSDGRGRCISPKNSSPHHSSPRDESFVSKRCSNHTSSGESRTFDTLSVGLLPPPPSSQTSSPACPTHATIMSTRHSSVMNVSLPYDAAHATTRSSGRSSATPASSPLDGSGVVLMTNILSTRSPRSSPLGEPPATIMSRVGPPAQTVATPPEPDLRSFTPTASPLCEVPATIMATMQSFVSASASNTSASGGPSATALSSIHTSPSGPTMRANDPASSPASSSLAFSIRSRGVASPAAQSTPLEDVSPGGSAALEACSEPGSAADTSTESGNHSAVAAAAASAFAAVINDTAMDPHTPPAGAGQATYDDLQEDMLFLQYQLDCYSRDQEFLPGLQLLGPGPRTRFYGEQAIVQLAHNALSGCEVAIKVFATRTAFNAEAALFCNAASPLRAFMPSLLALHDNGAGALQGAAGAPLPPCIVMDRGEPLDVFCNLRNPNAALTFTMVIHISTLLRDLHATGYVHRDFKPSNVLWVDSKQRWLMVGFDQAARAGTVARMSISTLAYTAPEVLAATYDGERTMRVSAAMDTWSLGVAVLELLLSRPAFHHTASRDDVVSQIVGVPGYMLPWEDPSNAPAMQARVGSLWRFVIALLDRDPKRRPPVHAFVTACEAMALVGVHSSPQRTRHT